MIQTQMPRKRILFATYAIGWGGLEKHLEDLILRLDATRVDPVILCFGPDPYRRSLNECYGLDVTIQDETANRSFLGYWRAFAKRRPHAILFVNGKLRSLSLACIHGREAVWGEARRWHRTPPG